MAQPPFLQTSGGRITSVQHEFGTIFKGAVMAGK
jgi:hypothetical protein